MARPSLKALEDRARSENPRCVAIRDEAFDAFDEWDLSKTLTMPPEVVGWHWSNRGSSGIEPQNVPKKALSFKKGGWSNTEVRRACAVEREPNAEGDKHEANNADTAKKSGGLLAPISKGSLKIFSLTVGHTAQTVRAVKAGCKCLDTKTYEEIQEGGHLKVAKVCEGEPEGGPLHRALEQGWPWRVICWQVAKEFPTLMEIICEADNIPASAAKPDSLLEKAWRAHRQAWHAIIVRARAAEHACVLPPFLHISCTIPVSPPFWSHAGRCRHARARAKCSSILRGATSYQASALTATACGYRMLAQDAKTFAKPVPPSGGRCAL